MTNIIANMSLKPCRRCYELDHVISVPIVDTVDNYEGTDFTTIQCERCRDAGLDSEIIGIFDAEKRWNDWTKPLESWENGLDW